MADYTAKKERFSADLERFFIGCDAVVQEGKWDKEQNGEMDGFYQNDLVCFIMRMTAADHCITKEEAESLNELFGFDYDAEGLRQVYDSARETIESGEFEEQFSEGLEMLRGINEELAELYKSLLLQACELMMLSDHFSTAEEKAELERIAALLR